MNSLMTFEQMLPSAQMWGLMKQQSAEILRSSYLPQGIKSVEQVVVIILKGRELGIPPMQALSHIHVINGKPTMSAELMLALILKHHPKTKISYPVRSSEKCEVKVTRDGSEPSVFSFSIADAQAAGLLSNPTWKKYPRAMLHARCISEMARSLFPDAISGVSYTPEELGAEVDEDGEVINVAVIDADAQKKLEADQSSPTEKAIAKYKESHAANAEKTRADLDAKSRREKFCHWAKLYCTAHGLTYSAEALARIYDHLQGADIDGQALVSAFKTFMENPDEAVLKGLHA
jgi:hypothetical protein